jgi:hypothetical protein
MGSDGIDTYVADLVGALDSDPEALALLCELIAEAYGDDGMLAGHAFRQCGGTQKLVSLINWWNMLAHQAEVAELRRLALELVANLSSDAVDPNSLETKRELLSCGGEMALLACLKGADEVVVRLTCGALQNLCTLSSWAEVVVDNGAQADLERLLSHPDPATMRYASGTLRNLQVALEKAGRPPPLLSPQAAQSVATRQRDAAVDAFKRKRAMRRITAALRLVPSAARRRRLRLSSGEMLPPIESAQGQPLAGQGRHQLQQQQQRPGESEVERLLREKRAIEAQLAAAEAEIRSLEPMQSPPEEIRVEAEEAPATARRFSLVSPRALFNKKASKKSIAGAAAAIPSSSKSASAFAASIAEEVETDETEGGVWGSEAPEVEEDKEAMRAAAVAAAQAEAAAAAAAARRRKEQAEAEAKAAAERKVEEERRIAALRRDAAVQLQTVMRGHWARAEAKARLSAAVSLQSAARARAARAVVAAVAAAQAALDEEARLAWLHFSHQRGLRAWRLAYKCTRETALSAKLGASARVGRAFRPWAERAAERAATSRHLASFDVRWRLPNERRGFFAIAEFATAHAILQKAIGHQAAKWYQTPVWAAWTRWTEHVVRMSEWLEQYVGPALAFSSAGNPGWKLRLTGAFKAWLRTRDEAVEIAREWEERRAKREALRLRPRVDVSERSGVWPFDSGPDSSDEESEAEDAEARGRGTWRPVRAIVTPRWSDSGECGVVVSLAFQAPPPRERAEPPSASRSAAALEKLERRLAEMEKSAALVECVQQRHLTAAIKQWKLRTAHGEALVRLLESVASIMLRLQSARAWRAWGAAVAEQQRARDLTEILRGHWWRRCVRGFVEALQWNVEALMKLRRVTSLADDFRTCYHVRRAWRAWTEKVADAHSDGSAVVRARCAQVLQQRESAAVQVCLLEWALLAQDATRRRDLHRRATLLWMRMREHRAWRTLTALVHRCELKSRHAFAVVTFLRQRTNPARLTRAWSAWSAQVPPPPARRDPPPRDAAGPRERRVRFGPWEAPAAAAASSQPDQQLPLSSRTSELSILTPQSPGANGEIGDAPTPPVTRSPRSGRHLHPQDPTSRRAARGAGSPHPRRNDIRSEYAPPTAPTPPTPAGPAIDPSLHSVYGRHNNGLDWASYTSTRQRRAGLRQAAGRGSSGAEGGDGELDQLIAAADALKATPLPSWHGSSPRSHWEAPRLQVLSPTARANPARVDVRVTAPGPAYWDSEHDLLPPLMSPVWPRVAEQQLPQHLLPWDVPPSKPPPLTFTSSPSPRLGGGDSGRVGQPGPAYWDPDPS